VNQRINIGIAEDEQLVRHGFISMLSQYRHINVLFEAEDGKELLKKLKEFKPAVILLDIVMPTFGGIKIMPILKEKYPKLKTVVISSYSDQDLITEFVRMGARSVLDKKCNLRTLVSAITSVYDGRTFFDPKVENMLTKKGVLPLEEKGRDLSDREVIALKLICAGKSVEEISKLMGISPKTVTTYYKDILSRKTGCKTIPELIAYGMKHDYI